MIKYLVCCTDHREAIIVCATFYFEEEAKAFLEENPTYFLLTVAVK